MQAGSIRDRRDNSGPITIDYRNLNVLAFLGSCLAAASGTSACRTNDRCRRKRSFDAARLYGEDAPIPAVPGTAQVDP
jgi:hypothetical protein